VTVAFNHDDQRSTVKAVLKPSPRHDVSTTSDERRVTTVLVTRGGVVGDVARVCTTMQVDGPIVGQEAKRLETESHQCVVDGIER